METFTIIVLFICFGPLVIGLFIRGLIIIFGLTFLIVKGIWSLLKTNEPKKWEGQVMNYQEIEAVGKQAVLMLNSGQLTKPECRAVLIEIKHEVGNEFALMNDDGHYFLMEDGVEL